MGLARDYAPLPAWLLDADYGLDFAFYGSDESDPVEWPAGSTFSLHLAPAGRANPAADQVHELTSQSGALAVSGHVVGIASLKAAHAAWAPGLHEVQLRRVGPDLSVEALYFGQVWLARGLSQLVALGGGDSAGIAGGEGVKIFREDGPIRILRGESAGAVALATAAAAGAAADRVATAADRVQTGLDAAATAADRVATAADRAATSADATATAADRVQTGLDVDATAADRTQTALDRIATGVDRAAAEDAAAAAAADRVQTGLDRAQTTADAAATAADRVLTGQDATATAADAAATAADRAQTTADAAATAADRVQTGEDRAQTTADAAATAADAAATATDRAQTTADAVATAADRVQTGEDRAQTTADAAATAADADATAADRAQTAADAAATAADRVQTGLDAAATAADRAHVDTAAAEAIDLLASASAAALALPPVEVTAASRLVTDADDQTLLAFTSAADPVLVYLGALPAGFVCALMRVGDGELALISVDPALEIRTAGDGPLVTARYRTVVIRSVSATLLVLESGDDVLPSDLAIDLARGDLADASGVAALAIFA